jgi:DNA modification methylase
MTLIEIETIHVEPGRVRTEFDARAHHELMNDILAFGLFHPPVVSKNGHLLAGERRFRALKGIQEANLKYRHNGEWVEKGMIPVTFSHEMDKVTKLKAEIAENTARVDLSWQDKAKATERLHSLMAELHGSEIVRVAKADGDTPAQRAIVETAAERRDIAPEQVTVKNVESVKQDLIVAAWLKGGDEEVANAPTRKEALRVIEGKLEAAHRSALAREFKQKTATQNFTLIHGDSREIMQSLPNDTFDVIVTDPPYGMGLNNMPDLQGGVLHHYDDSRQASDLIIQSIFASGLNITKQKAHLYMFCDITRFYSLKALAEQLGWEVWNRPLIWHRSDSTGMLPSAEYGPRRNYEAILFANKGKKRVLQVRNDVLPYASDREDRSAARKPVPLIHDLLSRSCLPGDYVFDPCCGSGPVFEAAKQLELRAYGIEQNEAIFGLATKRIATLG